MPQSTFDTAAPSVNMAPWLGHVGTLFHTHQASVPFPWRGGAYADTHRAPPTPLGRLLQRPFSPVSENTDLDGHDLLPPCGIKNVTEAGCCSACETNPQCTAFTYMPKVGNCCLKNSAAGKRAMPGYQSGTIPGRQPVPPPAATVNFTIHSASSPHGPWTATTMEVPGWNSSWTLQVGVGQPPLYRMICHRTDPP